MNPQAIAGLCGVILGIGVAVVLYYLHYDSPEGDHSFLTTGNNSSNGWSLDKRNRKRRRPRDSNCTICLGDLINRKVKRLACDHEFHPQCINKWLKRNKSCPNCRSKQCKI